MPQRADNVRPLHRVVFFIIIISRTNHWCEHVYQSNNRESIRRYTALQLDHLHLFC